MPVRHVLLIAALLLANAVAAQTRLPGDMPRSDEQRVGDAVTRPLADTNIRRRHVPPLLEAALADPYSLDGLRSCVSLRRAVTGLNTVLGPDVDVPRAPGDKRKGAEVVIDTAGDLIAGLLPFRGLVRQVSGAKRAERHEAAARFAGVARRSYLKGAMRERKCRLPPLANAAHT